MSERDSEKLRGVADWVRSISIPDIDELVSRFLTWPVPASVHPDGTPGQPGRTGTNLMTAAEAKEMLLYVLAAAPQASQPPQGAEPIIGHIQWSPGSEPSPELRATLQEMVTKAVQAASPIPAPQEPARPDILEKLTYHQHERDDLTLDECWEVLASGYRKVHGRTDRQMVMQILALLAAAPAPDSTP